MRTVQAKLTDLYSLIQGSGYFKRNQFSHFLYSLFQIAVGGPLETSCKYEGMLQSVQRKKQELERELSEINFLVHGLTERIDVERQNTPEYPVITERKPSQAEIGNDENDFAAAPHSPTTPPQLHSNEAQWPVSNSSTEVHLGDPRTPSQQIIPNEHSLYSPPRSCPMPGSVPAQMAGLHGTALTHGLVQPFIDGEPAGLPRYRVTNDDDQGLPWSFGCGSTLFGERLIEQECDTGNVMTLSFDDSLVNGPLSRQRAVASRSLAARTIASANLSTGDSLIQRGGSFDGPINFRTGMSGHTGLNLSRKKNGQMSRPHQVRMMSEHRGIAAGGARTASGGGAPEFHRKAPGMSASVGK